MKRIIALATICLLVISCKKIAGDGGNSSISGRVDKELRLVLTNPATAQAVVDGSDVDVYIVYGDNTSPDDRVQTNYDGEYEFMNLRPGNYTIYTFSKDTNVVAVPWDEDHMPVKLEIDISEKKENSEGNNMKIYDNE